MELNFLTIILIITSILFFISSAILLSLYFKVKNLSDKKEKRLTQQISFFSNVTHDLKTPISVILGAIQLSGMNNQKDTDENCKNNKNYDIIKINCLRLLKLINNLLDFTRIDSNYLKLNPAACNIVSLVEEITQSVTPYTQQKQLELIFDTETEEIFTAVDIEKIERVILNLLSNAIKFTESGGSIKVNIFKIENTVNISIRDTGIGVPKDKQKDIFERFHQVSSKSSVKSEGSGIGLSLVKSFVELHNGTINLISEQNKGSEFIINLPIILMPEIDETNTFDHQSKISETAKIELSDSIAL